MKKRLRCILLFILVANIGFAQDVLRDTLHYSPLGKLYFKGTLRNNKLDGMAYTYYSDKEYHKCKFKNGKPLESISYCVDSLGEHVISSGYCDSLSNPSQLIKMVYYFRKGNAIGKVDSTIDYIRGDTSVFELIKTYYPSGALKSEYENHTYRPFVSATYYESGKLKAIGANYYVYSKCNDTIVNENTYNGVTYTQFVTGYKATKLKTGVWLYYDEKGNSNHKCYIDGHEVDCEDPRFYSKMK